MNPDPNSASDELRALRDRCARLELLRQVSDLIHSTLDSRQALNHIVTEAVRLTRAASGSVVLKNPTTGLLEIEASKGLPPSATELRLARGQGVTGWVAEYGKPLLLSDVRADPRYVQARPEVRSELAVPLEVMGELYGALNVDADRLDAFSQADLELLQALAREAAKVIHNTWLYEQLRVKANLFETLSGISQVINAQVNLDGALKVITREACGLLRVKMCSLLLLDASGEWLDVRASYGAGQAYRDKPRLSVSESLVGVVIRRRKPIQVEDVRTSGRYQNTGVARAESLVSLLSVPLLFNQLAIGALSVYTSEHHSFSNEEIQILSAFAALSAIAIEKTRLYERIVDMEEQLRQNEKLSALGLLAAEVAHEIRNPLTVMKMLYHSLDLQFPANDPRGRDAEIMGQKMDHLNRIVEQILDFARTTEPRLCPVDVNALIEDLILLTRHKLKNQNIEFIRRLQPGLPPIRADGPQISQVFLNLALNAMEAMPTGGRLRVKTWQSPPETKPGVVVVEFTDTGPGMTKEQQRRLFHSILETSKSRGTGLGLAIVRRIVETHRGQIRVKSRMGHGTTFQVEFPSVGPDSAPR